MLAASVPSLPHTITVDEHSFAFDGCPQPLRPLLHDLMIFERPLITWDIFMQGYRTVNADRCELISQIPANDEFWRYFSDTLYKMSADQKVTFMNI